MVFSHLEQTFPQNQGRMEEVSTCSIQGIDVNFVLFNFKCNFEEVYDISNYCKMSMHGS